MKTGDKVKAMSASGKWQEAEVVQPPHPTAAKKQQEREFTALLRLPGGMLEEVPLAFIEGT